MLITLRVKSKLRFNENTETLNSF